MNSDEPISEADYKWRVSSTDGVAVSSYAFDDFGRNIAPRTGKQRKHDYTTNGNIIQPFTFTGYQEDEVSGLKFAQARFYSAENGRFVGEDQVRGLIIVPETINHFEYCKNNPLEYIDQNGKFLVSALVGAGIGAVSGIITGSGVGRLGAAGLTISGLTTGIGSPIASAITSLYSDEEEQCHE